MEAGIVCNVVGEADFDSDLISRMALYRALILGDIFNGTIRVGLLSPSGEALVLPAMAMVMLRSRCGGIKLAQRQTMPLTCT